VDPIDDRVYLLIRTVAGTEEFLGRNARFGTSVSRDQEDQRQRREAARKRGREVGTPGLRSSGFGE
jgi:hypothetical protein